MPELFLTFTLAHGSHAMNSDLRNDSHSRRMNTTQDSILHSLMTNVLLLLCQGGKVHIHTWMVVQDNQVLSADGLPPTRTSHSTSSIFCLLSSTPHYPLSLWIVYDTFAAPCNSYLVHGSVWYLRILSPPYFKHLCFVLSQHNWTWIPINTSSLTRRLCTKSMEINAESSVLVVENSKWLWCLCSNSSYTSAWLQSESERLNLGYRLSQNWFSEQK